ncbi:MAG: polysaccharide deacetylase family protein [Caryophanon sp.]|nr:polysaccharide deacetylase family protein [Caryophanon sp.]
MMKKWGLAFLVSMSAFSAHAAAEGIVTTEERAIYDATTNEQIGRIMPNVYYETLYDTSKQFYVQVETATGYVLKDEAVQPADLQVPTPKNTMVTIATNGEAVFYKGKDLREPMYVAAPDRRFYVTNETETYYEVLLFEQAAYVKKSDVREDRGIPVLLYHHLLRDRENENYRNNSTLDPLTFIIQMEYLKDSGYETISLDDLYAYINGEKNISAKSFALTFDDGLSTTQRYAYELLKAFNFKATNFIITSRIPPVERLFDPNTLQFLSLKNMDSMRDVFSFEGHTHNMHYFMTNSCGALVCGTAEAVSADIATSLAVMPHKYVAYPFGQHKDETTRLLKRANISMAFTTRKDYVHVGEDLYRVPRIDVQRSMTFPEFKALFE